MTIELDEFKKRFQDHLTDGLVTIIGSGLSIAEGIPGMSQLATHLISNIPSRLPKASHAAWQAIEADLSKSIDLESSLLRTSPDPELEALIVSVTGKFIREAEVPIIEEVIAGKRKLRFSRLLTHLLKPNTGIPVVTTNYDRLIEVATEVAGLGVDSLFVGSHVGRFDKKESRYSLCRRIVQRRKNVHLAYAEHVVLLKPHGSLDWYSFNDEPIRCPVAELGQPMIITPGLNKFRGGYERPFDSHRERANREIDHASRFLVIGYGFNDDHLQVHLEHQLRNGKPALLLTRSMSDRASKLVNECGGVWAVCSDGDNGTRILNKGVESVIPDVHWWDLGEFISGVMEP